MPAPLALTDAQLTAIMGLARPLLPAQRTAFLEMLAAKLNGRREIGDGMLYQLCRELQRPIENRGRPRIDDDDGVERPRRRRTG
jgi:hypothetical protein